VGECVCWGTGILPVPTGYSRGAIVSEKEQRDAGDQHILQLLKNGDPSAAQQLVDVFGDRVYGLSLRILASEEDAKEATQETFLNIWRKWDTFREKSKFSSWVYRISANQAYMKLRKKLKRNKEISFDQLGPQNHSGNKLGIDSIAGKSVPPDKAMERDELRKLIEKAVNSLKPGYRTAYFLKDIEGMSLHEIADAMNLSEPAVKSRVHRARLAVRKKLKTYM
jgi:RNA polymerase sigma-70 factor (ECF subfamily)